MKRAAAIGAVLAVALLALWRVSTSHEAPDLVPLPRGIGASAPRIADASPKAARRAGSENDEDASSPILGAHRQCGADDGDGPQSEEERREAEEEKQVDAFDDLTDKWLEPSAKGVTMADVDNFAKAFRRIPKKRQDECIHRALNLIPDENVMLLAGVLMDKSMDEEIVEEIYNDILNRDEDVKTPILQEIFKDKAHPCWADTAWILDVTGDLPKK